MKPVIAYIRVSTARQGKSGLGLEAQHAALVRFAAAEGFEIAAEHVEIETGKGSDAFDRHPDSILALRPAPVHSPPRAVAMPPRVERPR